MAYDKRKNEHTEKYDDSKDKRKTNGSRKGKNRGKSKSNAKRRSFDNESDSRDSAFGGSDSYLNDPSWYVADVTTADQAMRFSFDNFTGMPFTLDIGTRTMASPTDFKLVEFAQGTATNCTLFLNPSPGSIGKGNDARLAAINQQGFKLYSRLSSVNSKNTQYAPQDVTTLILAMGEIISTVAWVQRTFGLSWIYNLRNRTMPNDLIKASGFDSVDFFEKLAQYRIEFNTILVQANKIPFPSNFDYFRKCAMLYSEVYKDSDTDMSQNYVFVPASTWDLDESSSSSGTILRTHNWEIGNSTNKMSAVLEHLKTMINGMLTSATFNYIYSDILNFADKNKGVTLLQYVTVPEDYVVYPVYNVNMLGQINNMNPIGLPFSWDTGNAATVADMANVFPNVTNSNDVIPNMETLCLEYNPTFKEKYPTLTLAKYVNFHVADPDLNARIENTRYISGAISEDYHIQTSGTTQLKTGWYSTSNVLSDHYLVQLHTRTAGDEVSDDFIESGCLITDIPSYYPQYDWAPMLQIWKHNVQQGTYYPTGIFGDVDYFTTVSTRVVDRMNDIALYGLFEPKDFSYAFAK